MVLQGFVDGFAPLPASPYAGRLAVPDTDLPWAREHAGPVRVVVTGGAGQLAGPAAYCVRHDVSLAALDVTVRDLADPAGNVRRVVTAADGAPLVVRVADRPTPSWLAALDLLAEVEAEVAVPLPLDVEAWVDAALDRELRVSLLGGSAAQALDALRTTARLWGDADDLAAARRWCRAWLPDDAGAAITELGALDP